MENQNQNNLPQLTKSQQPSQPLPYSSTSEILATSQGVKIRDQNDVSEVINSLIARIITLLGIKDEGMPTPEQRGMMIQGIGKYYSGYTPEELFLACEMNHYGKYNSRIDHYGKFTIDYISSCLHLFNEEKKAAILRAKTVATPAPRPVELPTEQKRIHDLHRDKSYWDVMVNFVKEQGYIPAFWDWSKVYHYLKETGQFTDYSKERLDKIYEEISGKTKGNASRERMLSDTIGKMNFATASSSDERIKDLCRKRVVEEILTNQYSEYICRANPIQ